MRKNNGDNPSTLGDLLALVESRLQDAGVYLGHGTDNYWDESVHLVLQLLEIPLDSGREILEQSLSDDELDRVFSALKQRIDHRVPVPYITGEAWFAGMPFVVNEHVLIPRSPIAELIEAAFAPWCSELPATVLDLCCGGGCIGVACAGYMPEAQVDIADISSEALKVAEKNIQRFELQGRVHAVESDLFSSLSGKQYDLIVSNPPYVDAEDMASLPDEYRVEPVMALEAGSDGLDLVHHILAESADHLNAGGVLIAEVGNSWQALEAAYPEVPFTWIEFERGGHGVFVLSKAELEKYQPHFHV